MERVMFTLEEKLLEKEVKFVVIVEDSEAERMLGKPPVLLWPSSVQSVPVADAKLRVKELVPETFP
jgi:hypothetical protein